MKSLLLLFGLIAATFAYKIADNPNREKRFLFGVSIKLLWKPVNAATVVVITRWSLERGLQNSKMTQWVERIWVVITR